MASVPIPGLLPPQHLQKVNALPMESPTLDLSIHNLKNYCIHEEPTTDRS